MSRLTVEQLGKCYKLAPATEDASGSAGLVQRWWNRLRRRGPVQDRGEKEFWALRDVSFDVEPGTILGIIGANGAGKSTLLKVISRVTMPTTGRVRGSGRVVSLLELGAGFNPDMSARDNVIMNAAMNGIPRHDALARMGQILEFAEIGEFVDQPIKHFSSGMALRLAFSVAINMDPQILLADEILAVGDLAFQERCLEKVVERGREGLIVLFVSHDMDAIVRVCNRVLWLNKGTVNALGDPEDIVGDYQDATWQSSEATRFERGRQESRFAAIRAVKLVSAAGKEIGAAPTSEEVAIRIDVELFKTVAVKGAVDLHVKNQLLFRTTDDEFHPLPEPGFYSIYARIPAHLLADIHYTATVSVTTLREGQERQYTLVAYNALSFMAYSTEMQARGVKGKLGRTGFIAPRLEWRVEEQHAARA